MTIGYTCAVGLARLFILTTAVTVIWAHIAGLSTLSRDRTFSYCAREGHARPLP